ncbi:MAG: hypothetical protein HS104_16110 [Polyangiaceae bacterium]|nr:hypothetical protein [Polyangiaceae bacterium]MCL4751373.1 hypothetical protein [Myxococcales bacterium]
MSKRFSVQRAFSSAAAACLLGCSGPAQVDSESSCPDYSPQASPGEISKSPRPDGAAEILAIETADAFVAPDALYERIAAELPAIAALQPAVAGMWPLSTSQHNVLDVVFDASGWEAWQSASYDAWDCPNQAYGVTKVEAVGGVGARRVALTFGDKRFHMAKLAAEYAALPHVTNARQDLPWTDAPDVCLEIQGDVHVYLFDQASGDCPAGCYKHKVYGFRVAPGVVVTSLGTWDSTVSPAPPSWYTELTDCQKRLASIGGVGQ